MEVVIICLSFHYNPVIKCTNDELITTPINRA